MATIGTSEMKNRVETKAPTRFSLPPIGLGNSSGVESVFKMMKKEDVTWSLDQR